MVFLRPNADDADGNWLNEAGTNTNLFASIDEDSASLSDADYIQSPGNPVDQVCRIALSPPGGAVAEPFVLRYRFNNSTGVTLRVRLLQGTTEIASWLETGTGWITQPRTLTTPQFASITDFANLFIEFTADTVDTTLLLDLDFTLATLDSRVTFARANTGWYFDAAGLLQSAAANVPRITHDGATLADRGLFIEDQRTNAVIWNRDLTNGAWTPSNITAVKDQTGMDGVTSSASRITATAANGTILQSITLTTQWRAQSAWVKRLVGSGTINMTMNGGTTWTAITVTSGWTRVTVPAASIANPSVGFRIVTSGDSIAVDLVQNENGAHALSEIPTTTVAVTRAAESAKLTGTNFSSWYVDGPGTIVTEQENIVTNTNDGEFNRRVWHLGDTVFFPSNVITPMFNGADQLTQFYAAGSVQQAALFAPGGAFTGQTKLAVAWAVNDFGQCLNGGTVATDNAGTLPSPILLLIGHFETPATKFLGGPMKRLRYYNVRKTNAQLQALTA